MYHCVSLSRYYLLACQTKDHRCASQVKVTNRGVQCTEEDECESIENEMGDEDDLDYKGPR